MPFCTSCGAQTQGAFCTNCGAPLEGAAPAASQQAPPPQAAPQPASSQPSSYPQAAQPSNFPPASKKTSPWLWVAVGCFGIIVLAGVAIMGTGWFIAKKVTQEGPAAAIKMLAAMNPDIEVLDIDENAGRVTIRDKKTGKQMTIDLEAAKQGRITITDEEGKSVRIGGEEGGLEVTTPEGTARFGQTAMELPSWLPAYPGAQVVGGFSATKKGEEGGGGQFTTSDSPDKVATYYEKALKDAGMTPEVNRISEGNLVKVATVKAEEAGGREATIAATGTDSGTMVVVSYRDK